MLSHLGRLQERLKYWQRRGEAADVVFIQPPSPTPHLPPHPLSAGCLKCRCGGEARLILTSTSFSSAEMEQSGGEEEGVRK